MKRCFLLLALLLLFVDWRCHFTDARAVGPLIPTEQRQVVTLRNVSGQQYSVAAWSAQSARFFYFVNTSTQIWLSAIHVLGDDLPGNRNSETLLLGPGEQGCAYGLSTASPNLFRLGAMRNIALIENSNIDAIYVPDSFLLRKLSFGLNKGCVGSCTTCIAGSYGDCRDNGIIVNESVRFAGIGVSTSIAFRKSTGTVFAASFHYVYTSNGTNVLYYVGTSAGTLPVAAGMYTPTTRWAAKLSAAHTIVLYNDAFMYISDPTFGTVWSVNLNTAAFVALVGNGTVAKATCITNCPTQNSGFSLLAPTSMVVCANGDGNGPLLYIFESKNYVIWAYSIQNAIISQVIGTAGKSGSINGLLAAVTLGNVTSLVLTNAALVIVEPTAIRYVNLRRPVTYTTSVSRSNERTRTPTKSGGTATRTITPVPIPTTLAPTTTAAPTTTDAPTTTGAPTTTTDAPTTAVPTTAAMTTTDVTNTTAAPVTATTTTAPTTTLRPTTTAVPTTTVPPTPSPPPPIYTCRAPTLIVTAAVGDTEAKLAAAPWGSSIDWKSKWP